MKRLKAMADWPKVVLAVFGLVIFFLAVWKLSGRWLPVQNTAGRERATSKPAIEVIPTGGQAKACTRYRNDQYGFSLCYPSQWALPTEKKITPSQQHLYEVIFNPQGAPYLVDIYDQPLPVSLGSFVRDYFKDVEGGVGWSQEREINQQGALEFFIPRAGAVPAAIGAIAFQKKGYVLTIASPLQELADGDYRQAVREPVLVGLAESFEWVEK